MEFAREEQPDCNEEVNLASVVASRQRRSLWTNNEVIVHACLFIHSTESVNEASLEWVGECTGTNSSVHLSNRNKNNNEAQQYSQTDQGKGDLVHEHCRVVLASTSDSHCDSGKGNGSILSLPLTAAFLAHVLGSFRGIVRKHVQALWTDALKKHTKMGWWRGLG